MTPSIRGSADEDLRPPRQAHHMNPTPMTDEQMRVAIAEARGYCIKEFECVGEKYAGLYQDGDRVADVYLKNKDVLWRFAPNYLEDLNAMHEAEKVLNAEQQLIYSRLLHDNFKGQRHYLHIDFDVLHATARQRAIAFCKTLNLEEKR